MNEKEIAYYRAKKNWEFFQCDICKKIWKERFIEKEGVKFIREIKSLTTLTENQKKNLKICTHGLCLLRNHFNT